MTQAADSTRARIIDAGLSLMRQPPRTFTLRALGRQCGLTHQALRYHFPTAGELRNAVAAEAVRIGDVEIVRYLIVTKSPAVEGLTGPDRDRYMAGV